MSSDIVAVCEPSGFSTISKRFLKLLPIPYADHTLSGNEDEVGAGLKEAFATGVKREDIFVTTKLWCTYSSKVEEGLEKSLKALGLDYVDLYLVHWPLAMNPNGTSPYATHSIPQSRLTIGPR